MERVYLDSDVFIYYVEQRSPWFARILTRLTTNPVHVVITDLTRMECRVLPLRQGNAPLLADFQQAFAAAESAPLSAAVFDRATDIRATLNLKTPDSIHLAAAVEAGCNVYLSGDNRLARYTGITVEVI